MHPVEYEKYSLHKQTSKIHLKEKYLAPPQTLPFLPANPGLAQLAPMRNTEFKDIGNTPLESEKYS